VVQKSDTCLNCKRTPISTIFHCYIKKCMTHKNKITPATSPLLCNHLPSKTLYCC